MTSVDSRIADRFRSDLLMWSEDNYREFPWRDPDDSLYEVFVAEFFLTQTPAENVAVVYPEFLTRFPSLHAIDRTDRTELIEALKPIGFYNMRADALKEIALEYDVLPATVEGLSTLPRVGPYVANATICFALEERLPILDRNVIRVYERLFGDQFTEEEAERREFAREILPETGSETRDFNLALLDFGSLICRKIDPKCGSCFANDYCHYYATIGES